MGLSIDARPQGQIRETLPRPEDVFVAWLASQPPGADLIGAVDVELDRLGRYDGTHSGPARLAELFRELRRSIAQAVPGAALQ